MSNYNSKCPECGSSAYLGFVNIECSNPNCKNFVQATVAPPSLMSRYANSTINTNYYGTIPPVPPAHYGTIPATIPSPVAPILTSAPKSNWTFIDNKTNGWIFDSKIKLLPRSVKEIIFIGTGQDAFKEYKRMELLTSLFELVFRHSQEAVIAGGAARDIYLERISEINDFDFFVRGFDKDKFERDFGDTLKDLSSGSSSSSNSYAQTTSPAASKFQVYEGSVGSDIFQIIECDDIANHIGGFDFGLNMISIPAIEQSLSQSFRVFFHETHEFTMDKQNKTLTFFPAKFGRIKTLPKRWKKISAKFPNYSLSMG